MRKSSPFSPVGGNGDIWVENKFASGMISKLSKNLAEGRFVIWRGRRKCCAFTKGEWGIIEFL